MYTEILNAIQAKLKSLEYELKIWDDEFEGGGQLAKRELMGKVEAYREFEELIGKMSQTNCLQRTNVWCRGDQTVRNID